MSLQQKKNQTEKVKNTEKTNKAKRKPDKKNTSLRLEKKTLKALKMRAIEEETSVQKLVERLIKVYLKN